MAEKRFDANYTFKFNSVPFQNLFSPNQLRIDNWNKIVNQLSAQGNNLSQYLVSLNNWLFGTTTISYSTEDNTGFLQDLDNRIKENLRKININAGAINNNASAINTINSTLNSHANRIEDLEGSTNNNALEITEIYRQLGSHNTAIGNHTSELDILTRDLNSLKESILGLQSDIDSKADPAYVNNKVSESKTEIIGMIPAEVAKSVNDSIKDITVADIPITENITATQLRGKIIDENSGANYTVGNASGMIPVIGNDGKLPASIIPIEGLLLGGFISRVSDTEATVRTTDKFVDKYPNAGATISITTDTTEYSEVYFVVENATNVTILGIPNCNSKDWIVANGTQGFGKIDNTESVVSVNGKVGNVVIDPTNLTLKEYEAYDKQEAVQSGDTVQTAIGKVERRIINLEDKPSEKLPDVVLEIKDLNAPTISEQVSIINKIKELTNNFTTDLDKTKFNEIVLKNDKTTVTTTEGALKSLQGATIKIPSGWSCSSGFGVFNITAENLYVDNQEYSEGSIGYGIALGYMPDFETGELIGYVNTLSFNMNYGWGFGPFSNGSSFKISNITGGSDVTNTKFINWVRSVNGTITGGVYEEGETIITPDVRQYSLVSYEHKVSDPTYYKFTFNLDNNTEYEIIIGADETVGVTSKTFISEESDPTVPAWAKTPSKPSYEYSEINDTPDIPSVYNSTITIQKNGVIVDSFTLNSSTNKTINIVFPTSLSEYKNDAGFITDTEVDAKLESYATQESVNNLLAEIEALIDQINGEES